MKNIRIRLLAISVCGLLASLAQISYLYALSDQESEILDLTNQQRKKSGRAPLKINSKLMKVAQTQSSNMAYAHNLSHTVKGQLASRVKKSSYSYSYVAENIAQSSSAKRVIQMWMKSRGHRDNLLNKSVKEVGIGITVASNGDKYYTMVFGKRV